jgi:hypothetical protein
MLEEHRLIRSTAFIEGIGFDISHGELWESIIDDRSSLTMGSGRQSDTEIRSNDILSKDSGSLGTIENAHFSSLGKVDDVRTAINIHIEDLHLSDVVWDCGTGDRQGDSSELPCCVIDQGEITEGRQEDEVTIVIPSEVTDFEGPPSRISDMSDVPSTPESPFFIEEELDITRIIEHEEVIIAIIIDICNFV